MEAAFFDLDKTVIAKASMVAFGRPLLRAGMISRWLMVRALWSQMVFHYLGADEERMRKFRESALRITRGWDQERIRTLVGEALIEVIEPIVYDEALELIREHQRAGRKVFIISASPQEIVDPLAHYLGVDGAIATRAQLDEEGRYTGEVEFYSYGPYKAEAILEVANWEDIDLVRSYAYSDSITDLPMLEVVGRPVVVNPDRELARIARERDWEIRVFRIGVPLRERVPMPPPRLAAAIATTATLTAAGAAALWWYSKQAERPSSGRARSTPQPPGARRLKAPARYFKSPAASSPRRRPVRARR
jgi:HAD superfamily hydrolase (TIGR01490 family)